MVVRMFLATRQPTIIRLNASVMKQTYATPAQAGTKTSHASQLSSGGGLWR
jgi:hypothetical protein